MRPPLLLLLLLLLLLIAPSESGASPDASPAPYTASAGLGPPAAPRHTPGSQQEGARDPSTRELRGRPSYTFLVVGDWGAHDGFGGRFDRDQFSVARAMEKVQDQQKNLSFIVSTGDNFYPKGVTGVDDKQFERKWRKVYRRGSLRHLPWYTVLGDHDCYGSTAAIVEYAKTHASNQLRMGHNVLGAGDMARSHFLTPATGGGRYFGVRKCLPIGARLELLFIDTCSLLCGHGAPVLESFHDHKCKNMDSAVRDASADEQLAWIDEELGRDYKGHYGLSKAEYLASGCNDVDSPRWRVVVGHAPVESAGKSHGNNPRLHKELSRLFDKHGVHAYFNGHDHSLQHLHGVPVENSTSPKLGTHFFVSGSGGGAYLQKLNMDHPHLVHAESQLGFMEVTLKSGSHYAVHHKRGAQQQQHRGDGGVGAEPNAEAGHEMVVTFYGAKGNGAAMLYRAPIRYRPPPDSPVKQITATKPSWSKGPHP